jgi:choline dehydrogenase-like flavoprotein
VCVFGCPTSAKQHTGITYIPRARAAGAQIVCGADVREVLTERGRARGVAARLEGGRSVHVEAPAVILACGTIHTPSLLARSGLGGACGQRGRNLSLHPATAAFALMDEEVDMARGVPQSFYVDEFASQGIMLEGVAGPPAYAAMALPLTGELHAAAMARYPQLAQFGLMVSDSSRGRVRTLGGAPLIRYDLSSADVATFRQGLARLRELFFAAGAREVYLPLPAAVEPQRARARDLKLMAFHPLGTARADARATHGVTDGNLAVHGVGGVYVADGSVVPSALGVNPQLTIMALATRLAFSLLGRGVAGAASRSRTQTETDQQEVACRS